MILQFTTRTITKLLLSIQLKIILRFMPGGKGPKVPKSLPGVDTPKPNNNTQVVLHSKKNDTGVQTSNANKSLGKPNPSTTTTHTPHVSEASKLPPLVTSVRDKVPTISQEPKEHSWWDSCRNTVHAFFWGDHSAKITQEQLPISEKALLAVFKEANIQPSTELSYNIVVTTLSEILKKNNGQLQESDIKNLVSKILAKDILQRTPQETDFLEQWQRLLMPPVVEPPSGLSIISTITTTSSTTDLSSSPDVAEAIPLDSNNKSLMSSLSDYAITAILKEAQASSFEELSFESSLAIIKLLLDKDPTFLTPEELSSLTNIIFLKDKSLRSVEENQLLEHEQRLMCSTTPVVPTITTSVVINKIEQKANLIFNHKKGPKGRIKEELEELLRTFKDSMKDPNYKYESQLTIDSDISKPEVKALLIFELVFISGLAKPEIHNTSVELRTIDDNAVVLGEAFVTLKPIIPLLDRLRKTCKEDSELAKLFNGVQNINYKKLQKEINVFKEQQKDNIENDMKSKITTEELSNTPNGDLKFTLITLSIDNQTFIPTSIQKHINIAGPLVSTTDPANDNRLISIGYLTSQNNGQPISNTKFKDFQDNTGIHDKQYLVLFEEPLIINKSQVNILDNSTLYLKQCDKLFLQEIQLTYIKLLKETPAFYDTLGYTARYLLTLLCAYQQLITNDVVLPLPDLQLKKQLMNEHEILVSNATKKTKDQEDLYTPYIKAYDIKNKKLLEKIKSYKKTNYEKYKKDLHEYKNNRYEEILKQIKNSQ